MGMGDTGVVSQEAYDALACELDKVRIAIRHKSDYLNISQENYERELDENGRLCDEREALRRGLEEARSRIEELEKEAFTLSAGVCDHLVGDEHGHGTCKYRERLDKIYRLLLKFIKESVESPAVTPEEANLQQAMVMIMVGNIISPGMHAKSKESKSHDHQ